MGAPTRPPVGAPVSVRVAAAIPVTGGRVPSRGRAATGVKPVLEGAVKARPRFSAVPAKTVRATAVAAEKGTASLAGALAVPRPPETGTASEIGNKSARAPYY